MRTKVKRVLLFTEKLERFQHKLSESYGQVLDLPLHKELQEKAILASSYSQKNYGEARRVIDRVLKIGLISGGSLAFVLFLGFGQLSSLFTTDSQVLNIARSSTLFVAASQPMNAIAFVLDGLYYGVLDFGYASYSMMKSSFKRKLLVVGFSYIEVVEITEAQSFGSLFGSLEKLCST
ncbi:unnamed protein product [Lactuca saligna]|uniref:Uncharacterized protein n=1 Tax=Lactuca saligna TaxID=75948 RepID=A0AA36EEB3_LACSI|nr:unnamed protein product [Lactuca saligna]